MPTAPRRRLFSRRAAQPAPTPLPAPLVDPGTPAATLVAEAEAHGVADAKRHVRDSWSFGHPATPVSEEFDPSYVVSLRHRCVVAVQSIHARHVMTMARTAHLRDQSAEANRFMVAARTMMDRLALRAARAEGPAAGLDAPGEAPSGEDAPDDDPVWEGETTSLGLVWRLLIVLGLIAAETPVHYLVFEYFLMDRAGPGTVWMLSLSMAVFLVTAPHVAAVLVRGRQATGTERRFGLVVVATALFWTLVVVILGRVSGSILDLNQDRLAPLHLTTTTVVLMFVGMLVVVGGMAFMLGLSRRHPFQEAYVRHRRRREELEARRRALVDQLDPQDTEAGEHGEQQAEAHVEAVRAAYAAAEEAYFAALTQTVGDPSFTEAVQHRRGVRQAVRA